MISIFLYVYIYQNNYKYNNIMNKINNMTFNELKNELHNCGDNKIKEKLIRELMLIKYQQYINQKQNQINKPNKILKQRKIKTNKIPTNEITFNDDDFNDNDEIDNNDNKIIEYGKDVTNNNLMDRLNNDVEIKTMKVSTSKRDVVKPFVNSSCDTYATFKQEPGTDIKSFKN